MTVSMALCVSLVTFSDMGIDVCILSGWIKWYPFLGTAF